MENFRSDATDFYQILQYILCISFLIFVVPLTVSGPRRKSKRLEKVGPLHQEAQNSVCCICGRYIKPIIKSKTQKNSYRSPYVPLNTLQPTFLDLFKAKRPNSLNISAVVCLSCNSTSRNSSRQDRLISNSIQWDILECNDENQCELKDFEKIVCQPSE